MGVQGVMVVRIAFPTGQGGLDDLIYPRFGRAPTFTIVDVDENTGNIINVQVVQNPGAIAGSGAGVRAAQTLGELKVNVVAGPTPGPNAYAALQYFGIKVIPLMGVKVRDAIRTVLQQL